MREREREGKRMCASERGKKRLKACHHNLTNLNSLQNVMNKSEAGTPGLVSLNLHKR